MKKNNSVIPFCLVLLILFSLSACISYNEFAQRKYLKGNFYDKAERYPVIHSKTYKVEYSIADTLTSTNIDPHAVCVEDIKSKSPVLYLNKDARIWDKLIPSGEQVIRKKIILSKKSTPVLPNKTSENVYQLDKQI